MIMLVLELDALEAIFTRRSVSKVLDRRPDKDAVARLLDAAVRAPNHHLTEPWRFIVLAGEALDRLGDVMAERVRSERAGASDLESRIRLERARPRRAPVIVTVVYVPSDNPKAVELEDRHSVGAAMQNILLAAHAEGLGAYLRTGPAATDPAVHRFLGLTAEEQVAGFIYVGYPAEGIPSPTPRTAAAERTAWQGWD